MKGKTLKWRTLLAFAWAVIATSGAHAQNYAPAHITANTTGRASLRPIDPPVIPHSDSDGSYGLRLHLKYFETLTGKVELRRHQYFPDDRLKTQYPRTSIAWSVRFRF